MNRDEGHEGCLKEQRMVSRQVATMRIGVRTCRAVLGLSLLSGLGASPARAAGLDVVWTRSAGTTRPAVVALSPDGQMVATGTEKIRLWRTADGSLLRTLDAGEDVLSVTFSPDGQLLASGHLYGDGRLWRVSDGQLLRTFDREAIQFAFTPDNRMLAVMGKDDTVQLSSLPDEAPVRTFEAGPRGYFPYMALSPDGQFLATGTADAKLWRVSDGQLLATISGYRPDVVAFSPDSQVLAFADKNAVLLWRMADGTLLRTLTGHKYFVFSAAFSKDGKILVTSSDDVYTAGTSRGEINFWSVENGQLLQSYDPGAGVLFPVALSPDNSFLIYGLADGSVAVARSPYAPRQ
jgi:WD40 repeat protein